MFLSQSEIATWARCPRKWFLDYYLGFQPADEPVTGNRQLGTRVHTALEGHFGYGLDPIKVLGLLYAIEIQAHAEEEIELKNEMALAMIMVSGYLEWLASEGKDAGLRMLASEADIQVPLPGTDVILRGRIDTVIQQESDGALLFRDFKTAGGFDKHEVLEMDPQFRFYALLFFMGAGHGEPVPGMELRPDLPVVLGGIMDTLRRVKRTSASKPPYYQRDDVSYNIEDLHSTLLKTRAVASEISRARASLDNAYQNGGELGAVNYLQRSILRPVPIAGDCDWRCAASKGLCVAMDDGSDWPGILERSGRFVRGDPYARYSEDPLRSIREKIANL